MKHEYPHSLEEIAENEWEEVTAELFHEMLGCLPPYRCVQNGFVVGEPLTFVGKHQVCDTYIQVDDKYYHKPQRVIDFDVEKFQTEIRKSNYHEA
jgi:hypothetical protein